MLLVVFGERRWWIGVFCVAAAISEKAFYPADKQGGVGAYTNILDPAVTITITCM